MSWVNSIDQFNWCSIFSYWWMLWLFSLSSQHLHSQHSLSLSHTHTYTQQLYTHICTTIVYTHMHNTSSHHLILFQNLWLACDSISMCVICLILNNFYSLFQHRKLSPSPHILFFIYFRDILPTNNSLPIFLNYYF